MSIPARGSQVHPDPTHQNGRLRSERDQTDESLRVERESVDEAAQHWGVVDETADAIVSRARARADAVLAAARARTDRQWATAGTGVIGRQRVLEDTAIRTERADADQALREERAEHATLLSLERKETDQDLLNERTRADDAVATRDDFLGIVSHDLRNILHGIVGYAALIETGSTPKSVPDYAQRIRRSGARMDRLIGDLVDVASIEASRLAVTREVGDPTLVVSEAVESFQARAAAGAISLAAEIVSPPPLVAFDSARILQVLTNLLSNAVKFTPPDGRIVVRIERDDDEVRFAVEDTGAGIPEDKLDLIFSRFVQVAGNDRRGVGLGLYISKCIVQGHGGRIWAERRAGGGTTVSFTLPIGAAS